MEQRKADINAEIDNINGKIAIVNRNADLDKQIQKLREEKRQAEINKAAAEKILDQVEKFKMAKNNKLSASINSNFRLVQFRLFKILKNGTIEEDVTPLIDGKPMDSCCNGSLITLCKISICADLQRYFNQLIPIICDDYSLMSSNTKDRLDVDSQFIGLVVTEDTELKIKEV